MTQIRNLPLLSYPCQVGSNEDWEDSFPFVDASGNPISGVGIVLQMMVRQTPDAQTAFIVATTSGTGTLNGLSVNGSLSWTGTGSNLITLAIPDETIALLDPGSYVFEIQGVAEITRTLISGTLTIVQGIVR